MRLNAKTAKELRGAAQYQNQSVTPSMPVFPGIARLYTMPVYQTRPALRSTYEKRDGGYVRVLRKVSAMAVVGRRGRENIIPHVMVEHAYPTGHAKAGQKYWGPRLEMVPVTKPVAATGEKKLYRQLKRLHDQGLLGKQADAIYAAFARLQQAGNVAQGAA